MPSNSTGRRTLLSQLEGIIGECVRNINHSSPHRYPVTWPRAGNLRGKMEGKNRILNAQLYSLDDMLQGYYEFGANHLFVYQALNKILHTLEKKLPPGAMDELYDRIEEGEA